MEDDGDPLTFRKAGAGTTRGGTDELSPEQLSDLIGAIYDCVLNPENWGTTLESINRSLAFQMSAMGLLPLRAGTQVLNVAAGADQDWLDRGDDYSDEMSALWGGPERLQQYPLGEPIVHSQTSLHAQRHANRYYRDILQPRGMIDSVGLGLAREPLFIGYVAFSRHVSAGPVGHREVHGLRLLGPHFRRAVTISNLFDFKAVETATFSSVLDALALGVVLVDEKLGVVHANIAAEKMLAEGDLIRSVRGTLTVVAEASRAPLEAAVEQAVSDEAALGQRGIGIPALCKSGEPAVIHVLPLRRGELRPGLMQRAVAALFVVPPERSPGMPTNALALFYDLTPAETRVLELVCAGKTPAEISEDLGIARSTFKTHLLHVFQKTGCKRQVDLLKLAARLSLPV